MNLLLDGTIIVVYFVVITTIGLYMGRREDTLKDFALGGRRVPWWAVMASIIAAETSAATFLGTPGEGFESHAFHYVQLVAGLIIGRVIVGNVVLTIMTCIYTAIGGIKAVIWTDVIQACMMFGGALIAIATLLYHVGGIGEVIKAVPTLGTHEGYFLPGFEADVVSKWRVEHPL